MIWTGALKTNRKGIYAMAAISRRDTLMSVSFSVGKSLSPFRIEEALSLNMEIAKVGRDLFCNPPTFDQKNMDDQIKFYIFQLFKGSLRLYFDRYI